VAIVITRAGFEYVVQHRPLAAAADRGEQVVKAFLTDIDEGLKLSSVVRHLSREEMVEIPRIRRLLDAFGGTPPSGA
jgi:hypothetical protein